VLSVGSMIGRADTLARREQRPVPVPVHSASNRPLGQR